MKINRRDFLLASSSSALLLTRVPASAQNRRAPAAPKAPPAAGSKVFVYTTAEKTEHRISPTDTLTFKPMGQPLRRRGGVFVDPTRTYQTMLGIGGALTDASAETFAKVPDDKQREILDA